MTNQGKQDSLSDLSSSLVSPGEGLVKELQAIQLHYPPNGHHYCRWCGQRTSGDDGGHVVGCGYLWECSQIDAAKTTIRSAAQSLQAATERAEQAEKERGWAENQCADAERMANEQEQRAIKAEQAADQGRVEAHTYLSRLLVSAAPQCEPLPDLLDVCTQIDNLLVGLKQVRLEALALVEEWRKRAGPFELNGTRVSWPDVQQCAEDLASLLTRQPKEGT